MILRVLIVEDSEDDGLLLIRELTRAGYEVHSRRVEEAVAFSRALQESPWDLVLADYSLPRFGGVAALEIVNRLGLDLPFIMVSGTITDQTAVAAMKAGANDYVMKGNLSRLAPAVERELKEAANRRDQERTLAAHEQLRRLHADLELAARLRQALITVGRDLVSTLEFDEVLRRAVSEGAQVLGADSAALEVRRGPSWLVRESYGRAGSIRGLTLTERQAPLAMSAMREKRAFAVADASLDSRLLDETRHRYHMISALVVPLFLRDEMMGVILFAHSAKTDFFKEAHLEFARNFSVLIALALENARLYDEQRTLAHKLETALLNIPAELPGVKVSHVCCSATRDVLVGGDFYDVFACKGGQIGLLIGDVSGRGVEAARIATLVKDTVQAFAHQFQQPQLVLRETNRLLLRKNVPGFVTAFLGYLRAETGMLTYSCAGHPPPLVARDHTVTALELYAMPLGVANNAQYRDGSLVVAPGTTLLLYTDGITEARQNGSFFGEARLMQALGRESGRPVEALPSTLMEEVLGFCGGMLADDAAMLAVSYVGTKD